MTDLNSYLNALTPSYKADIFTITNDIIRLSRPEIITSLKNRIKVLKDKIEDIMLEIDQSKGYLLNVNKLISKLEEDSSKDVNIKILISLLKNYATYIKDTIGNLRPQDYLKEKSELESKCSILESYRDASISLQRMIDNA